MWKLWSWESSWALMPLPVFAILLCTVLVVRTHLKKEWTQSTQQTQYRTLAQALWVISKGTTLSSNLSDFFLTWRMLSKILESKNEELPMLQVYSHHCSPPQDRTLSKGANIPEKDSRQRTAYGTSAHSSVIRGKVHPHNGKALVSALWEFMDDSLETAMFYVSMYV